MIGNVLIVFSFSIIYKNRKTWTPRIPEPEAERSTWTKSYSRTNSKTHRTIRTKIVRFPTSSWSNMQSHFQDNQKAIFKISESIRRSTLCISNIIYWRIKWRNFQRRTRTMIRKRFWGRRKDHKLSMWRIKKVSLVKKAHIIEELKCWQRNVSSFLHMLIAKKTRKIIFASPSKKVRKRVMRSILMTLSIQKKKSLHHLRKPTKMQIYKGWKAAPSLRLHFLLES